MSNTDWIDSIILLIDSGLFDFTPLARLCLSHFQAISEAVHTTMPVCQAVFRRNTLRILNSRSFYSGKSVCLTALQPTGTFHLGNYVGAVQPFVHKALTDPKLQTIMSIADLHALTDVLPAEQRRENILSLAAAVLAGGVNPEVTVLFQQSAVPEHTLLAQILINLVTVPQLMRQGHFKEKASRYKHNAVPMGVLTYPVLQAADILLYKADLVPVGPDQQQNVQIAQFLQRVFNSKYSTDFFPYPAGLPLTEVMLISSLRNPGKKMSKSDVSDKTRIDISDTPEQVMRKVQQALTDFHSHVSFEPQNRPAVSNLIRLHSLVTGKSVDVIVAAASELDLPKYKQILAHDVANYWTPFYERYMDLIRDEVYLTDVLEEGRRKAVVIAERNMDAVREIVGLKLRERRVVLNEETAAMTK